MDEYEYRIYSFLANRVNTNMNIEYIRYQKNYVFVFEYLIFVAEYSNIRIYSCYTVKFGKSQHANLKKDDDLTNGYDKID